MKQINQISYLEFIKMKASQNNLIPLEKVSDFLKFVGWLMAGWPADSSGNS